MTGVPVGRLLNVADSPGASSSPPSSDSGSIVVVLATNAPLSPRQLTRIARRAVIGIGRTGSVVAHGSGDFVIVFSTANCEAHVNNASSVKREQLLDDKLTLFFAAAVDVTEEAILNALCVATSMVGRDGNVAEALPLDEVQNILREYGHCV